MSSRSLSDIQTQAEGEIGCKCFIVLKKRVHWQSNFKNKYCLSRENESSSLCKSGQTLTDLQTLIKH